MSDTLAALSAVIPEYRGYGDEASRHDTEARVRACAGAALAGALERAGAALGAEQRAAAEKVLLRCQFVDQQFVKAIEHADLSGEAIARLEDLDRRLIASARALEKANAGEVPALADRIGALFDERGAAISSDR